MVEFDREHIWHPYTSIKDPLPVFVAEKAHGVRVELGDGRELIDGMSSWWAVIHGYNNPIINDAIERQLHSMAHVMFGGLTHAPAVELARKLCDMTPEGLDKVFFCDSGSVAVEVACKMALQYMYATGSPEKNRLATIRRGYHGDTWNAMSVCDPVTGMHSIFSGRLPLQFFAPEPQTPFDGEWDDSDFAPMARLIEENHAGIAAVILEPVVQGAGSMRFYHPRYLDLLREWCDRYDILLIFDEIATGFGRTGKMFATEYTYVTPDIMCLGKALTGGYMSFAAVMASEKVASGISSSSPGSFMHGPTFMGNPLACAAANASLDILIKDSPLGRIAEIERLLREQLEPARTSDKVRDVRVLGAIGVIEMKQEVDMAALQAFYVERGVWIRPFGRYIYIMPPYIILDHELEKLTSAMVESVFM